MTDHEASAGDRDSDLLPILRDQSIVMAGDLIMAHSGSLGWEDDDALLLAETFPQVFEGV